MHLSDLILKKIKKSIINDGKKDIVVNTTDEIIIKDTRNVEYKYKVTSVKNVEPDNLECLIQDTSKVEITLITCDTGGTSRVVVKAEQVAKDNG